MDDSNALASHLQMFFHEEPDDQVALAEMAAQLRHYRETASRVRTAWELVLANPSPADCIELVEGCANRWVQGSSELALQWLGEMYGRLDALWRELETAG